MAKAGADVIKAARTPAAVDLGSLLPVEMLNANKRAISIDLMAPGGHDLLIRLECRADVPIEKNIAPGVMNRRGVGWRVLGAADWRHVYAGVWGFGRTGCDRNGLAMGD